MFPHIPIILHITEHICTFSSQISPESFVCVRFLWLFIGLGYSSFDLLTQLCHKCSFSASLFFFLFFNWIKIALQCFDNVCCTTTQTSQNYTYFTSFLSFFPSSYPSPLGHHRTGSWAPRVVEHLLFSPVTYFTHVSVNMSTLLSPFFSFLPLLCPEVQSLSASPFLP